MSLPSPAAVVSSKLCLFPGSSSYEDLDIMEVTAGSSSLASSSQLNYKRVQVVPHNIVDVPHDIVEVNEDDEQDDVVIIAAIASDYKNKQPVECGRENQIKVVPHNIVDVPHDIVEVNEDDEQDEVVIIGAIASDYKNKQPVECGSENQIKVVPHNIIDGDIVEVDENDEQDEVVIIGAIASDYKNKQPVECGRENQIKDASPKDLTVWSASHGSGNIAPLGTIKTSETVLVDLNYTEQYDYNEDEDFEDDYEDYEYDTELIENDCDFSLAAKFDGLNLPPDVEAVVPWLQKSAPERPINNKMKTPLEDEIVMKFDLFKQFDTVEDHLDHHFSKPELFKLPPATNKPSKDWAKRIQNEWKILEQDLPETIYIRIYEDRMDLLRAVIVGPDGTPYHDGLFFFDVYLPPTYPNNPPKLYYHSGGLRLNPNLYECGKVCLSLLNTWTGTGCERWIPATSTLLQVLVSIQALVLNAKPYFNEPGFAPSVNTPEGEEQSLAYNEETFLLSCKTMLYSLRKPPKHFEDFIAGHFRRRGHAILRACKAYMDGTQVGCLVGYVSIQDVDAGDKSCSPKFEETLKKLFEDLLMEFTVKGADCNKFLAQKVKDGVAKAEDTTLKL